MTTTDPTFDDPGTTDELGRVVLDALPPDVVAANRAAWVAALRSDDYQQAQGLLRVGDPDAPRAGHGYCCLGVAEDVGRGGTGWTHTRSDDLADDDLAKDEDRPGWALRDERVLVRFPSPVQAHADDDEVELLAFGRNRRQLTELTGRACRWLGLLTANPSVVLRNRHDGRWTTQSLVNLNDEWHLTFAEIADVLEDQPADWNGTLTAAEDERRRRVTLEREAEAAAAAAAEETP